MCMYACMYSLDRIFLFSSLQVHVGDAQARETLELKGRRWK